ncbi:MAG: aminoglycoside phosphotransferase family protein [Flavobacteriaceae bacterium]
MYSNKKLNTVLERFVVSQKKYDFKVLTDGFINDTFLVSNNTNPQYVLQRVNHNVFKNIDGLMGNINTALEALNDPTYSKITLIKTNTGKTYSEDDHGYWRLMTFIDHSTAYNTTTDPNIAFEAGKIIGKFHLLLANSCLDSYVDTIPRFHDLNLRKKQFEEALTSADSKKIEVSQEAIVFAKKILVKLEDLNAIKLPVRVCHNDTKLNNILFSENTNTALCLIDLDTLMKGYFYYDFGDAVRTIANTALEDEQDHSKIVFDKGLFEALVNGFAANEPFLNAKEIETLPLGAIFMPFIHGLRALTDYLNNNIYYKVSHENQNLDRCLSLFDFTQKALNEQEYMKTVVTAKLLVKKN